MFVCLTSKPYVEALMGAALLIIGAGGCQRYRLLTIHAQVPDGAMVTSLSDVVTALEPPIYTYESPRLVAGDDFAGLVGVYLPLEVKRFEVTISLYTSDCRLLEGRADLQVASPTLAVTFAAPRPDPTCDGGQGDVGGPDQVVVADADDAPRDSIDAGTTDGDTTDVTPDAPACFDPAADAGSPTPLSVAALNPDCDQYCDDVTSACPSVFSDSSSCRVVCTRAGWHTDAEVGQSDRILSCLGYYASRAKTDPQGSCRPADPALSNQCLPAGCDNYCELREVLCNDDPAGHGQCVALCNSSSEGRLQCLVGVLLHDVPLDSRSCSLATLDTHCGLCGSGADS